MKANKRIRDARRRSAIRLFAVVDGRKVGTTKYPYDKKLKRYSLAPGKRNNVRAEVRATGQEIELPLLAAAV